MSKTGKTLITVAIAIVCGIVMLIGFGAYLTNMSEFNYKTESGTDVVVKDISVKALGESYPGQNEDGYNYYELTYILENPYNVDKDALAVYFYYRSNFDNTFYGVHEIEDTSFFTYDNRPLIPAGKEAAVTRVIAAEQGCNKIEVIYNNYYTENTQTFEVDL